MVTLESSLAETEFPTSSFKIRNRYKIKNEELSVCKVENFGPSRGETDMLKTEMVSSKVNLDKCRY